MVENNEHPPPPDKLVNKLCSCAPASHHCGTPATLLAHEGRAGARAASNNTLQRGHAGLRQRSDRSNPRTLQADGCREAPRYICKLPRIGRALLADPQLRRLGPAAGGQNIASMSRRMYAAWLCTTDKPSAGCWLAWHPLFTPGTHL